MKVRSRVKLLGTVGEAYWALLRARIRIMGQDGNRVLADLSDGRGQNMSLAAATARDAAVVARAIRIAGKVTPWRPTCLVQALAAAQMLRRRHVPAQLFVGVLRTRIPGESSSGGVRMEAHAWVRAGEMIVSGALPDMPPVLAVYMLVADG
jgi:hypothetical protein